MLSFSLVSDPVRDALQARVTYASDLVSWATIIVAMGVALEGVELFHDAISWAKRKRREERERGELQELRLISPASEVRSARERYSEHPGWVKRVVRFGLILVVVGVVGEWRFGVKLEDAHNAVHGYDIARLTEADQKAGNAANSAKIAHAEADAVKGIADEARADSRDALAKAQSAQRSLARAESDAAKAQTVASNALTLVRSARSEAKKVGEQVAKLEKEAAWRDLTPKQQSEIASAVRKFGPIKYSLVVWGNTPEQTRLADKLIPTLGIASWTLDGWGFAMAGSALGVVVSTEKGSPPETSEAAEALKKALNDEGIFAVRGPQYDPGSLPAAMAGPWKGTAPMRIGVGFKP